MSDKPDRMDWKRYSMELETEILRLQEELEQAWQERNVAVAKQVNDLEFYNNQLAQGAASAKG